MKKILHPLIASVCLFSIGCASIVSSPNRPVAVTSEPVGAGFVVKKDNGIAVSSGVTPATIVLSSSGGYFRPAKYLIEFTKDGHKQTVPLSGTLNGWYIGNFLFGGLIGLLIVDPATGAMWRLDDTVMANFNHVSHLSMKNNNGLKICSINDIPLSLRGQLKPIGFRG